MRIFLAVLGATLVFTAGSSAQNYSIDWFTIDGGGGTSTGGVYSLTGTIGQPDAGTMSGGSYSLVGGFWGAVIPVQQVGSPTLFIENLLDGTVRISWAPNTPGFTLQESPTLSGLSIPWANAPVTYTNGATIPASMQTRFFRLVNAP